MEGSYEDLLPILAFRAIIVVLEDTVAMLGALGLQATAQVRIGSLLLDYLFIFGAQKLHISLLDAVIFTAILSIFGLIL